MSSCYLVVVAMDFGTSFSGYTFSFKSNPEDMHTPTDWGKCLGISSSIKTPTCVLLDSKNKFVAMGYDAQQKFGDMSHSEASEHRFFDHFKMKLHNAKKLGRDTKVKDHKGDEFPALAIFGMVLQALKDEVLKKFKNEKSGKVSNNQICWVITVPAIWSESSKQFMREAAVKAGITGTTGADNLVIALEPEVASIWCRKRPFNEFSVSSGRSSKLEPGTNYVVLDCGGGTLDITAHMLLQDHRLEELYQANGGPLGAARVDEEFLKLLDDIFEHKFTDECRRKDPQVFNSLLNSFEDRKKAFDPDEAESFNLPLLVGLNDYYEDEFEKPLRTSIKKKFRCHDISCENKSCCVKISSGILRIPADIFMKIFNPLINDIITYVKELMKNSALQHVSKILMVGGFSDSKVLQKAIKSEFSSRYEVLVPREAWSAVMKGAVLFGHQKNVISSRKARKTYGVNTIKDFDATKHDPNKTKMIEGVRMAEDTFSIFVRNGEKVNVDADVKRTYTPSSVSQTEALFRFFETDLINPKYTDESGVREIGKMTLQLPGKGLDRVMEVSMKFGGTEIKVKARDIRHDGAVIHTTLDFLWHN